MLFESVMCQNTSVIKLDSLLQESLPLLHSELQQVESLQESLWQCPFGNVLQIIKAAKSDSRLANSNLPPDIQKLRCRVHYDALRFAPHIEAFGKVPKTLLKYLSYQHLDAWIFFLDAS